MACFPRFFHRTKTSYNPAEDDNTDTILNNVDNPVQIGRYIRREEKPVFTPKTSERLRQQTQQQEQPSQKEHQKQNENNNTNNTNNTNNINNNSNNNNNNNSDNSNNSNNNNRNKSNSSNSSNNVNNLNKKFISNKNKSNSFNTNNQYTNTNTNTHTHLHTNSNTNANINHAHLRLRPVKERRPTALPTEVPKFGTEDDEHEHYRTLGDFLDNISYNDSTATFPSTPTTPTTPSTQQLLNVKFFIGGGGDEDATSGDISEAGATATATTNGTGTNILSPTKPTTTATITTTSSKYHCNNKLKMPTTFATRTQHTHPQPHPHPHPSNAVQQKDAVFIPTPPPMPPHLLTTASSAVSLLSQRSTNKSKRSLQSNLSQQATTPEGNTSNNELQSYTLAEVLSLSNNSTTAGSSSYYGRDSGVQIEDQASTPKESDGSGSPKTQRIEGGLIFQRTNLPVRKDVEIEFIEKDQSTRNLIRTAIEKNDFLNNYMDKERKEMVIDAMGPASYDKGSFIINENEEGSEIFVSAVGEFDVIKGGKVIGNFGKATVFGELAILYNAPRFASIKATTSAYVWKIDRDKFRKIMVISGSKEREENLQFLRSAPFLSELSEYVLKKVVDLLQRKFYETNSCIVREGDVGNEFFIIRGGGVTIKKRTENNDEQVVDHRKRGEYFGEQALLNADVRQASVYADAPGTEVLKLDREAFISYLGTIPQLHEKPNNSKDIVEYHGRVNNRNSQIDNEFANIGLTDLKKIVTLGAGAFGRVDLVAYGSKTFALKIIKKVDIIKQDQIEHVYSEKHVMMQCRSSPFIIELYKTYRNKKFVYFLMEACMGGDVWTVMSQRRFFDEKTARFIAGCVVEAFDFLHAQNIIYRDLKPENLMLSTDGYCKLVDFGFAKHIAPNQKTNTFAGTPEYVAPEIILDRGHDRSVDYWALGILIFELLVGKTPFRGQNQIKIYQQILGGIDVIQMPSKIPKSAQGLIKQLCKQLPAERLGYQRKGIMDIKRHSWFDSLDWSKLKNKKLPSPIKRPITSNTDVQYFGDPPGVENEFDPPDETSGWDIDF